MRVDPKGYYLYWIDQNNEMDILDIATIRDTRTGAYAKKPKVSKFYEDILLWTMNTWHYEDIINYNMYRYIFLMARTFN